MTLDEELAHSKETITSMRTRMLLMRDALEDADRHMNVPGWCTFDTNEDAVNYHAAANKVQRVLGLCADLSGFVVCDAKPFVWVGTSGHGTIVSSTPPLIQSEKWKQCHVLASF